jgi:hypothetical protein
MITTDFTGNFGNHLFQYVALRSIAQKKGYDWGFTKYIYGDYYNGNDQMDFLDLDYGISVDGISREYKEKVINLGGHTNIHLYHDFGDLLDGSKLVGCWQTEQYFDREMVKGWVRIKDENLYEHFTPDDNVCILNIRGGEYKGIRDVILPRSYWVNAMNKMLDLNGDMRFLVITDDVSYAKRLLPELSDFCYHNSIAVDYYIINKAKFLILSNSSFAWFPTWLNYECDFVIAPKYWSRYNFSDGYWGNSNIFTDGWFWLNRNGELESYDQVVDELRNSKYSEFYNL